MSVLGTWWRCLASALAIGGLLSALSAAPARAQQDEDINTLIARARVAEQELHYEEAASLWLKIILRPDASGEQLIVANLNAGRMARLLQREEEARAHFVYVLQRDPERQLPRNDPPRLREFFEQVRAEVRPQPAPEQGTAVGTSDVPPPPPTPDAASDEPQGSPLLLVGGVATAALGALGLGLGGVLGAMSAQANEEAEASQIQVERGARFADRDLYATVANVGFASGGLLLLAGGGVLGYALLWEED